MLRLVTFGGLSIRTGDGSLAGLAVQRRRLALLALLAVAGPAGLSREKILLYLWPESDEEHGRNLLRQALHTLRRSLGAPALVLGTSILRLNPESITTDVGDFEEALRRGELERAISLYAAPFLDGFYLDTAAEFERWVEDTRANLAQRVATALEALARQAESKSDHTSAARWWRRLASMEPLNTRVTVAYMDALAAAGNPAAALQHARIHEILLREELGTDPSPAVLTTVERIRCTGVRPSAPHRIDANGVPPEAMVLGATSSISPALSNSPAAIPESGEMRARPEERPRQRTGLPAWTSVSWRLPAAILAITVFLATIYQSPRTQYSYQLDPTLVVVAPYGVFDSELQLWRDGLVDVLSHSLDGVGALRTVAPTLALRRWRGQPDPQSAAALGRATGAGLAVTGTLVRAGQDSVRVTATLVDVERETVLGRLESVDALSHMDRLIRSLTLAILRELEFEGRPPGGAQQPSIRFARSLEALKPFLRGEQFYRHARWDSALAYFKRAVAYDSEFALALRRIGNVLSWQRHTVDSLALSYLLRAGEHNFGLGTRDSLLVAADSLAAATSLSTDPSVKWRQARRLFATLQEATSQYPESPGAWLALGEAGYHFGTGPIIGVPEREVLAAFDRAIALDSAFAPAYIHPVELGFNLGGSPLGLRYAKAYLALKPREPAHEGVRLVTQLVGPERLQDEELERLLDTVTTEALVSARTILRRWPDSAETAIELSRRLAERRPSTYRIFSDRSFMRQRLAQAHAFRGHLDQAYDLLGNQELPLFAELAYLGAVPQDTAAFVFESWRVRGSPHTRLALSWWSKVGDTASIEAFRRHTSRLSRSNPGEAERLSVQYEVSAAEAHLALAKKDSAEALRRFQSLPDSLCLDCYVDRLVRARLLASRGRYEEAINDLSEPLSAFLTPMEVLFAYEGARAAQQAGEHERAHAAYEFVARAWLHAGSELQPLVTEARSEGDRLAMRSGN